MSSKKKANAPIDLTDDLTVYSGGLTHLYRSDGTCIPALSIHKALAMPKLMAPPPVDPTSTPLSFAKRRQAEPCFVKLLNISWHGVLIAGGSVLAALSGLSCRPQPSPNESQAQGTLAGLRKGG